MPVPTFTALGPDPQFGDVVSKINTLTANLQNLMLSLDSLNVTSLSAGTVIVYDLDGGPGTITLTKDGMVINNGSFDTFVVDINGNVTMTSALIRSSTGFPRVIMDPTNNNFRIDQDSTTSIVFNPDYLGTTPVINFHSGSLDGYVGFFDALNKLVMTSPDGVEVEISNGGTSGDVSLRPVDNLNIPDWQFVVNDATTQTLQQALDAKADGSGVSGTVYVASSSGGPTTTAITFVNGVRTS